MFDVWQKKTYIKSSASINDPIIMISVIKHMVNVRIYVYILRNANVISFMNVVPSAKYLKIRRWHNEKRGQIILLDLT